MRLGLEKLKQLRWLISWILVLLDRPGTVRTDFNISPAQEVRIFMDILNWMILNLSANNPASPNYEYFAVWRRCNSDVGISAQPLVTDLGLGCPLGLKGTRSQAWQYRMDDYTTLQNVTSTTSTVQVGTDIMPFASFHLAVRNFWTQVVYYTE